MMKGQQVAIPISHMQRNLLLFSKYQFRHWHLVITLLITAISFHAYNASAALDLPRDEQGWTIFTPSDDSRIMYVDPVSGNDSTGSIYDDEDAEIGANPFNPVGSINAFATFAAAVDNARYGYPDYVLLKRGTTLREDTGGQPGPYTKLRSGRSATEPFVFGAYGSGPIPVVEVSGGGLALYAHGSVSYLAVSGIDFYAYERDPENPEYDADAYCNGVFWLSAGSFVSTGRLIEGCRFRFFNNGINIAVTSADYALGASIGGLTIRRCSILNSYSNNQGHSQGVYITGLTSVVFEENIVDHNGWYSQSGSGGIGYATIFNHNTYLEGNIDIIVRDNIVMRGSSGNIKFANYAGGPALERTLVDNNLVIDGEICINAWGEYTEPLRYNNFSVTDNVCTNIGRSNPTNREVAWYMELVDFEGGMAKNNLFMNQTDPTIAGTVGIQIKGYMRNTDISENILYNLQKGQNFSLWSTGADPYDPLGVTFTSNIVQNAVNSGYIAQSSYYHPAGKVSFADNKYYSKLADGQRFMILNTKKTDNEWATETGDTSTFEQVTFTDPTRSIETYMQSIGEGSTIDQFIAECRAQNRYNWDERFSAAEVNAWIRVGFDVNRAPSSINPPSDFRLLTNR